MKTLACILVLVTVAAALPQGPAQAAEGTPLVQEPTAPSPDVGSPQPTQPTQPAQPGLGPRFYGPGLNNIRALPTNQEQIKIARQIFASIPNVLARVLVSGQIEFTDQHGQALDIVDKFGNDPLEFIDPEERFELEQEQREREFKFRQLQQRLQRQQQQQQQQQQQLTGGRGGANGQQNAFSIVA